MTLDILLTLLIIIITIILFVTEIVRVDVVAILIMITLPWLGLISPIEAFLGFASNAVIAIIGIMILGYGIDRSGVMNRIIQPIINAAGESEKRLTGLVSLIVGGISSFMQKIGAAALFLPSMLRISKKSKIPVSKLLMPMGFAAILGGTLTLFASSPLIMINDLLSQEGLPNFGVFSVTPIGFALLGAGIGYFLLFGKSILPSGDEEKKKKGVKEKLVETWALPDQIFECEIPEKSSIIGETPESVEIWKKYNLHLLAISKGRDIFHAPWRHTRLGRKRKLLVLGSEEDAKRFAEDYDLVFRKKSARIRDLESEEDCGFAEVIIPPKAPISGKTLRELEFRKTYRVEPIMLLKGAGEERKDFSDQPLEPGDALIIFGSWKEIEELEDKQNFVSVTPVETMTTETEPKPKLAILCFVVAIALAIFGIRLSLSLMTGALGMILLNVVPIREAYEAIDWRTVFLIAGLIPLGIAMENSGTASYISSQMMSVLQGTHPLVIMFAIGGLATLFTLFMSNVATTVLLVPIAIFIGQTSGINPSGLALLVAICASNSFILPTHQVNALLMSPGGYHTSDYIKAGAGLSIIFISISTILIYLIFI